MAGSTRLVAVDGELLDRARSYGGGEAGDDAAVVEDALRVTLGLRALDLRDGLSEDEAAVLAVAEVRAARAERA